VRPDVVLALKQALVAALRDPAQRARVVQALRGAELWAATWPNDPSFLRTLTSSARVTALPLFSDERELNEAAVRYGWLGVEGQAQGRVVHISEAVRAARQLQAQMLVIDAASEHALELDDGDMELLASAPSTRPGPGSDFPKTKQLRSTPPPPADGAEVKLATGRPPGEEPVGHYSPLRPTSVTADNEQGVSATFGATPTATMLALDAAPADDMLEELTALLRNYPEVEWACLVSSSRADRGQKPSVALRIEPAFRKNLVEISEKIRETSQQHGTLYDVLMLDTPEQMKQARHIGLPFYPWRKKSAS
jgi:SseB protein N-terminal domain